MIEFALTTETPAGPVNPVSLNPLRNAEVATAVAHALGRKAGLSLPAFMVRLLLGEIGEEFIPSSRRIQPAKLLAAGYQFRFPELEQALRHEMESMTAGLPVKELQP